MRTAKTDQTGRMTRLSTHEQMPRLIRVFAGRSHFVGFVNSNKSDTPQHSSVLDPNSFPCTFTLYVTYLDRGFNPSRGSGVFLLKTVLQN